MVYTFPLLEGLIPFEISGHMIGEDFVLVYTDILGKG
jgi:hypothetical protein